MQWEKDGEARCKDGLSKDCKVFLGEIENVVAALTGACEVDETQDTCDLIKALSALNAALQGLI